MSLTPTQRAFATSREPFPAFVGGFGSGKTAAAIARAMALKSHFRSVDVAYYLPSFPLVEDIAMRRFPALCESKGWAFKMRGGTSPHIEFPGAGRILFRSMSAPESIVGYEVGHSICDELDTLPAVKAADAWNKIIARNRAKLTDGWQNTVGVATTPEGYRFVYDRWVRKPAPGYVIYRAKTSDNAANLPPDYIANLRNSYSPQLLSAYLDGEFVNLSSGSVYPDYDRQLNGTTATINPGEPLHIGMDFNVRNLSAVVFVMRDGDPHAVAEMTGVRDTPTVCDLIKSRYAGHPITIYPDASGAATKSVNASLSDIVILRAAGYSVLANGRNPAVRDRVAALNAMIHNSGKRRLRINSDACPHMAESLEQQAYDKNGEPDKSSGHDHLCDSLGYPIAYRWPLSRGTVQLAKMQGV